MKNMEAKLEVIRFDAEDTIATSGGDCRFNINGILYVNPVDDGPPTVIIND